MFRNVFAFVFIFCFASFLLAKPDLQKVISEIQKTYDKTTNFQANFTQKYTQKVLRRTDESQGKINLQKPGKLRWDYTKPNEKLFVISGETLYAYQPQDKQAYVDKCFKQDALTASIAFLWGQGKINDQFQTAWFDEKKEVKDELHIALTPKQKNSFLKKLILVVDANVYRVKQSIVVDLEGNLNQFVFTDLKFNEKIPASTFEFKPPAKTHITPLPGSCKK